MIRLSSSVSVILLPITFAAGQKARESEERKTLLRNKIEIKRLTTIVNKLKGKLTGEDVIEEEEKIGMN
jgi:hypothetical protein